nr:hypothetical transcript [Hymenolepis microstoma]
MRSRVASEGTINENKNSFLDYKTNFKSQELPSGDFIKTSQVLLNERNSTKQFKKFYSHLKFAYTQLQESYTALEERFSDALQEWLIEKQLLNDKLNQESEERQNLEFLCVELQKTSLTPERLELIKCNLQSELQGQYDLKLRKALKELDLARNEYNRAMEDLEKLKISYKQLQISFKNLHDKNTLIQESERQFMTESHQEVVNRLSTILGSDTETLLNLFRENSQILARCNIVLDESEKSNRLYDTQLSELKNDLIQTIDALTHAKSDRAILEEKYKVLKDEAEMLANSLSCTQTELKTVRQKVVDVDREKLSIEDRLKREVFNLKAELSESRLVAEKKRIEIEKQRDELAFLVQDLTNKMKLTMTKYEESEAQYQQYEQKFASREWDLQKRIKDTTEASKCRDAHILSQLERAQLNLKELGAQCKKLTTALSESEKSRLGALQKLNQLENQNFELKCEFTMVKQELTARLKQIKSLECTMQELISNDEQIPEKDTNMEENGESREISTRGAYMKLIEKFKSQKMKLSERIQELNADLISKSHEMEYLKQENERLKHGIPQSEYLKIAGQLKEFKHRKEIFWLLLQRANDTIPKSFDN